MGKLWNEIRAGLREVLGSKPIATRMTEAQALEAARPTIDARGGVHPDQRLSARPETEGKRVIWSVKVMHEAGLRGGHLHVRIDDATGEVVKVFEVPH
jgi:hypothetical protein